jgi:naphtho-gamma-pyrone polyketide synthase
MDIEKAGFDVAEMKVMNPLISQPDKESQLFRVTASADWTQNTVSFSVFSVNDEGKKTADHATFVVQIIPTQTWMEQWKRSSHLVHSRIRALYENAENGDAHRLKRRLAYQLFSTIVQYSPDYQGMEEVILDSEGHEATAKVAFQVGENGFTFNPCWVDSLGHIAGFIMNASDATPSKTQVFINHGWERMRCAVKFSQGKQYQVYNRMQLETGSTYVGDTYIFDGAMLVAIFEGVRVSSNTPTIKILLTPRSSRAFHAKFWIAFSLQRGDRV